MVDIPTEYSELSTTLNDLRSFIATLYNLFLCPALIHVPKPAWFNVQIKVTTMIVVIIYKFFIYIPFYELTATSFIKITLYVPN